MNKNISAKTSRMVQLAILTAIIFLMGFTPIGFLHVGAVEITFIMIPVIIGAIVIGPGAGAFLGDNIVSIAFFNLISFGNDRRIPYLCGVWTNPTYRQNGLAMQVNKKLMQGVLERREELADKGLLTIEGNEAALRMYEKLGYKSVNGEMTFLGDVKDSGENVESYTLHIDENCDELFF